ncbi:MAG TPA: hypothetical protein VJ123_07360 [Anaerolineales bacterium]|nr:hypothetical protein [Anaerolineales bacterium]
MAMSRYRGSRASLFLPALLLSACGTLQLGLEQTATASENLASTVSALSTENADLATLAAAAGSGMGSPEPIPGTPTSTPSPTAPLPPSAFWESMGVDPDTVVPVLLHTNPDFRWLGDIGTMHLNGTRFSQLSTYAFNLDPVVSPDGRRIAYRSVPNSIVSSADRSSRIHQGVYNIWVLSTDGSQAWQLTASEEQRGLQVWSPDSQNVAFSEGDEGLLVEMVVESISRVELAAGAFAPRYRPDGGGIGFVTAEGGLAWVDRVGQRHDVVPAAALTKKATVLEFDWLPDGQHVVYSLAEETGQPLEGPLGVRYTIWVAESDGSRSWKITEGARVVEASPNGRMVLAFSGSGYGDACGVDRQLSFLVLAPDLRSAELVSVDEFQRPSATVSQSESFYPVGRPTWATGQVALSEFDFACEGQGGPVAGRYLVDPIGRRMIQVTRADLSP